MKALRKNIIILSLGILAVSCKKEEPQVNLQSLNKVGEEHYLGEKVLMWASTEGEKEGMTYEWRATGGTFEGFRTQNLFENMWIAPTEPGEFEVTAIAKNGKSTSSKTTKLRVTQYFFDEFQTPLYMFRGQGWLQSNVSGGNDNPIVLNTNNKGLSTVELSSNRINASNTDANIRRLLNQAVLKAPFSIKTKLGWRTFFKAGAPMQLSLLFVQPVKNTNRPYIREIRLTFNPNLATGNNFQIRYETFVPATGVSTFSGNSGVYPAPIPLTNPPTFTANNGRNPFFLFANGEEKTITLSLDADNVFIAHLNGVEWFRSNGIKDWLASAKIQWPDFEDPIAREYRVSFPGRVSEAQQPSTIFLNSVYISNDGTILNNPI